MKAVIFAALTLFASTALQAETIEISVSKQGASLADIDRPTHGMTKAQVEAKFGAPQEILDAVGDPPITTWAYEHYSVYFEYDIVLHTVLNQE